MRVGERAAWAWATVALYLVCGASNMAPGACFGDCGELQAACGVLGIAHPPGYVGFTALGWLATEVLFFVEPAVAISLVCLAAVAAGFGLLCGLLCRLQVSPPVACALSCTPMVTPAVWRSMVAPEVYAPSLLCLVGIFYCVVHLGAEGRRRRVWVAAALWGLLAVNRPATLSYALGLLPAFVLATRGLGAGVWRKAVLAFALPVAAAVLLTLVRDTTDSEYNYIEHFNLGVRAERKLPEPVGVANRLERAKWLFAAEQYHELAEFSWTQLDDLFDEAREQLSLGSPWALIGASVLLVVGLARSLARRRVLAVSALGIAVGQLLFLAAFRLSGQEADVLPLSVAGLVVVGTGLAGFGHSAVAKWSLRVGAVLLVSAIAAHGFTRTTPAGWVADAEPYLARIDWDAVPEDAVIITKWWESRALYYALIYRVERPDLVVHTCYERDWVGIAARYVADRPVLFTGEPELPAGYALRDVGGFKLLYAKG